MGSPIRAENNYKTTNTLFSLKSAWEAKCLLILVVDYSERRRRRNSQKKPPKNIAAVKNQFKGLAKKLGF
jgi:hypothetical protein